MPCPDDEYSQYYLNHVHVTQCHVLMMNIPSLTLTMSRLHSAMSWWWISPVPNRVILHRLIFRLDRSKLVRRSKSEGLISWLIWTEKKTLYFQFPLLSLCQNSPAQINYIVHTNDRVGLYFHLESMADSQQPNQNLDQTGVYFVLNKFIIDSLIFFF